MNVHMTERLKMKTNVMRLLDAKKIPYVGHEYEQDPSMTGAEIASILGRRQAACLRRW